MDKFFLSDMVHKIIKRYTRMEAGIIVKEKMVIVFMVIILGVLLIQISGKKKENKQMKENENQQTVEIMAQMENTIEYENNLKKIEKFAQDTSCGSEYLDDQRTNERVGSDVQPDYTKLYPDLYVDKIVPDTKEGDKKIAYLTFDDGPSSNTLKVLDILKEKGAKATFFVLGSTMTKEGEQALKQMSEQDCTIGIHTYSHKKDVIYHSVEGFLDDFYKVYTQIYELTGEKVNIFRFPWGSYNKFSKPIKDDLICEMGRRGFTYYDWNVSAEDSVGTPTPYSITKNVMKDIKQYSCPVILMHDASVNKLTVETLPSIIDAIKEMGYEFGTLDEREPCQFCY